MINQALSNSPKRRDSFGHWLGLMAGTTLMTLTFCMVR